MDAHDGELLKNAKFRAFGEEMTVVLAQFEKAKKWPDLVKHMQKVQKVLEKYCQFPAIPTKMAFCKRVAQCLNPDLPAGVHVKALQTLSIVLKRIGPDRLARDLSIYSMGIFPLFQYGTMKVKPLILDILENDYLPLGMQLIPCLTGILIAILPGLEEEGGELYDRVLSVVNRIAKQTEKTIFYRALWKCAVASSNVRRVTIVYLDRILPIGVAEDEESMAIYLPERQTLVKSALKECLQDPELLTQRAAMEILLKHFPISSGIFEVWDDIAAVAIKLVLLKEIALNRRLYSWFLGTDNKNFEAHGKKVVIAAVQQLFSTPPDSMESATHPFKIMKVLLKKQEIGEPIIESVLISVFYSLHRFKEGHEFSRQLKEQVNILLDELIQPEIIWDGAIALFVEEKKDAINIIDSLIDVLRCDEETQTLHLPRLLSILLQGIEKIGDKGEFEQMYLCLLVARKVFGKFSGISTKTSQIVEDEEEEKQQERQKLKGLYTALLSYQNVFAVVFTKYLAPHIGEEDLQNKEASEQKRKIVLLAIELLVSLFIYLPSGIDSSDTLETLPDWLLTLRSCVLSSDAAISCLALKAFVELFSVPNSGITAGIKSILNIDEYIETICTRLWNLLGEKYSFLHFRVSEVFCKLLTLSPRAVNSFIGSQLLVDDPIFKVEACKRFDILWKLINDKTDANPIASNVFIMIDTLSDGQPMVRLAGRSWLSQASPKSERVLEPMMKVLLNPNVVQINNLYIAPFDTQRIVYVFNLFKAIYSCDPAFITTKVVKSSVFTDLTVLNEQQELHASHSKHSELSITPFPVSTFIDFVMAITIRFVQGFPSKELDDETFISGIAMVQSTAASFMNFALTKMPTKSLAKRFASACQERISYTLHYAVDNSDFVLQAQLLRLLKTILQFGQETAPEARIAPVVRSPLFIQTLTRGLEQPMSSSVRHYWADFITTLISFYGDELKLFVTPVSRCLCDIVFQSDDIYSFQSTREILVILDSLQNIMTACLKRSDALLLQAASTIAPSTSPGILSTVVSVFGARDEPQALDPIVEIRRELLSSIPYMLKVFLFIWQQDTGGGDEISNKFAAQDKIVKILDPIFKTHSNELIYAFCSLIEGFRMMENGQTNLHQYFVSINEILNAMDSVMASTIFNDCSLLVSSTLKHKATKSAESAALHEITVIDFVFQFLSRSILPEVEITKAITPLVQLVQESMVSRSPNLYLLLVQVVNIYTVKSNLLNVEKRLRKEYVDTIFRLVDQCLKIASDHRATISKLSMEKGSAVNEKAMARIKSLSLKTIRVLADVVPTLYGTISDDKNKAASNVVITIMSYLRDRSEHNLPWADVSSLFLENLIEKGYSLKLLKRDILDIFNGEGFFLMDFIQFQRWRKIINEVMEFEKNNFADLLFAVKRSIQSHASMVFVTKDQENLLRARNIKRMSFVLLSGAVDQYLTVLPAIQEQLFEALKLSHAPSVYEQVFDCMRVLLLRFSHKKLSQFWPVVVSELMRIFGFGGRLSSDINLILCGCKFFDLAVISGCEQFKMYEWIFIRDYFHTLNPPAPFVPFVEQLASLSSTESPIKLNIPVQHEKQPLILLRSIDGVEQLSSYLRHYSETVFTNLVTGGNVVEDILEGVIAADMIEFPNISAFAKNPFHLINERIKKNQEKLNNTLKIETYSIEDSDLLMDDDTMDDLAVSPAIYHRAIPLHEREAPPGSPLLSAAHRRPSKTDEEIPLQ